MKKFSTLRYTAGMLSLCLAFTLASCDDEEDFMPGALTAEGAIGAYFNSSNTTSFILTPQDGSIELTVSRRDTDSAAIVPITMTNGDATAIQVPESIAFAAGDSTQTLTIGLKGLTEKVSYGFKLAIGESAADHYAKLDGTTTYSGSIIVSQWKMLKDSVSFYYNQNDNLPKTTSELWQLDGINMFYVTDFMGSGAKMYFSIRNTGFDPDSTATWYGELVPSNSEGITTLDYGTYSMYYVWLGLDDYGYSIYNWTMGDTNITNLGWYVGSDYSYFYYSKNYLYLSGYVTSNKFTGYADIYGVWQ